MKRLLEAGGISVKDVCQKVCHRAVMYGLASIGTGDIYFFYQPKLKKPRHVPGEVCEVKS
jgi:hypothetical protein